MVRKRRPPLVIRAVRPIWAKCNDVALRIRTVPSVEPPAAPYLASRITPKYCDSVAYAPADYAYLRKVRRMLHAGADDVIYDLGCGMGRFLCLMARRNVRRCVGVELDPELCEIAQTNARHLRGRKAPIGIVCADAATADLSEGTIYYMYNPFGADTLREVVANLRRSWADHPRSLQIVYYNALHECLLASEPWLEKYREFKTLSGMLVSFWRSCGVPASFRPNVYSRSRGI